MAMAPEISDPEMMELQGEVGYLDQITVDRQHLNQPVCPLKICQIYLASRIQCRIFLRRKNSDIHILR